MKYIILMLILLLSSCSEGVTGEISDSNINSGIPIYKKDNIVYYCEIKDGIYSIVSKNNELSNIATLEPNSGVTALFADDEYLYYTLVVPKNVSLFRISLDGGEPEQLFTHELTNELRNDYIYVSGNTVYYFIPNDGLWEITDGDIELIAEETKDCVIADKTIYYSEDGNVYSKSIDTGDERTLITKKEIFESGQNDQLLLQTLGDGYVDNMLLCKNKLYFLVTDGYSGGIFCMDLDGRNFDCVDPEYRVYKFMFDQNGDMYMSGVNFNTQDRGLFEVSDNIELICDDEISDFYINNGCYYYKVNDGTFAYIK